MMQKLYKILQNHRILKLTLLTKQATINNVIKNIKNASDKLKDGDIFMIYYSAHGGQMLDANEEA